LRLVLAIETFIPEKFMQKFCAISWRLMLPVLALSVAACKHGSAPSLPYDYDGIFFPRQQAANVVMEALMVGQLVEVICSCGRSITR
jgi:hypothetical protein